jgi:hypothetical protein
VCSYNFVDLTVGAITIDDAVKGSGRQRRDDLVDGGLN